ncbi:LOW QUALITY PROTEIN: lck-interacting transmembrane adapter 1 [Ctenodactylus gundi]
MGPPVPLAMPIQVLGCFSLLLWLSRAPRPASMDLLHRWLEISKSSTKPQAASSAFPPHQLPGALPAIVATLPIGSEAICSSVGLATIPRACLASTHMVWAGTPRPLLAEYTCIQKLKGIKLGPDLQQGKAEVTQMFR